MFSYLPNMLMCETSSAVSAWMESASSVDISMLPHVVHGCIMLAAHHTNISLLTSICNREKNHKNIINSNFENFWTWTSIGPRPNWANFWNLITFRQIATDNKLDVMFFLSLGWQEIKIAMVKKVLFLVRKVGFFLWNFLTFTYAHKPTKRS